MESTFVLIKKTALLIAALVCFLFFVKSLFNSGRVALFGIPVSGLAFGLLMRALWRKFVE